MKWREETDGVEQASGQYSRPVSQDVKRPLWAARESCVCMCASVCARVCVLCLHVYLCEHVDFGQSLCKVCVRGGQNV